jgi:U3 small nucleolar RNA-associated protein 3
MKKVIIRNFRCLFKINNIIIDTWGHKRNAYYDGDDVNEDEDAKLEEEEAMRLQKKRTEAMEEADFVDFSIGSLGKNFAQTQNEEEDNQLIAQLNEQLEMVDFAEDQEEITKVQPAADSEDPWQQLEETSPEVIELMAQLKDKEEFLSMSMQPVINRIKGLNKKPSFINQNPLLRHFTLKYELFLCYIANVAYYLSLKAQQVPNSTEHPVLETLVQLNTLVDALEQSEDPSIDLCDLVTEEVERLGNILLSVN